MNGEIGFEREARLSARFFARVEPDCRTRAILESETTVAPRLKRGTDQAGRVHVARALEKAPQVDPPGGTAGASLEVARQGIPPQLADSAAVVAYLKR